MSSRGLFGSIFDEIEKEFATFGHTNFATVPQRSNSSMGTMSQQVFVYSSKTGPDGKRHEERYQSSSFTDAGRGVHESRQAYANSSTGDEKFGHARILGDRGKKTVTERNKLRQDEEKETEILRGFDESQQHTFEADWASISDSLPRRSHAGYLPAPPSINRPSKQLKF